MRSYTISSLLVAASIPFTLAQTFSACKDDLPSCPAAAAQKSAKVSFNKGLPDGWVKSQCNGEVKSDSNGVSMTVAQSGDCPAIETEGYVFFGLFEISMKASPGTGIVSSIVMESQALDEVDWEFIGSENNRVQSNYFGKGNTTLYNRMIYVPVTDPQNKWHTYGVNWTSAAITWLVDGVAVRTLNYNDAVGGTQFPQTPMKLKIGAWAGGDATTNSPGTVTWAGGNVEWNKGPFAMSVQSANLVNYSPGESYSYGDNTGSWQSIKVNKGQTGGTESPSQAAAKQSTQKQAIATSVGSGIPVEQPFVTAAANSAGSSIPSNPANATSVASGTLKATGTAKSTSATKSGAAKTTSNAAAVGAPVSGAALLAALALNFFS